MLYMFTPPPVVERAQHAGKVDAYTGGWATITVLWRADKTNLAVVAGQWRRLPDGGVEATYTRDELELALALM